MMFLAPLVLASHLLAPLSASFLGSPVQESRLPAHLAEVRVTFAPHVWEGRDYENGPGVEELCGTTKKALENRFQGVPVLILDDAMAGVFEYRIFTGSPLTELQLGLLGTAQPELNALLAARPEDFAHGVDLAGELKSARHYLSNPRTDIAAFNALPANQGGAPEGLFFAWQTGDDGSRTLVPLFDGSAAPGGSNPVSVSRVFGSRDPLDHPALGFEVDTSDKVRLDAFIAKHAGRELHLLVGTEILARPKVTATLSAGGLVSRPGSGFQDSEVKFLLELLKAPRFPLRMRLLSIERP